MPGDRQQASQGIGLLGMVFIVFLTLKLLGKITWSWLWVTAPLWGGLALVVAVFVTILGGAGVAALIAHLVQRRRS